MKAPINTVFDRIDMTTIVPAGIYKALIYSIVDKGTQKGEYKGEPNELRKVLFQWEIQDIMHVFSEEKGEQPISVSAEYTLSLGEKASLRQVVQGFLGKTLTDEEAKDFDIASMLGKTCFIQIKHNKQYLNVVSVANLRAGNTELKPINPLRLFDLDKYDEQLFQSFSKKLQETIQKSPERQEITKETKF